MGQDTKVFCLILTTVPLKCGTDNFTLLCWTPIGSNCNNKRSNYTTGTCWNTHSQHFSPVARDTAAAHTNGGTEDMHANRGAAGSLARTFVTFVVDWWHKRKKYSSFLCYWTSDILLHIINIILFLIHFSWKKGISVNFIFSKQRDFFQFNFSSQVSNSISNYLCKGGDILRDNCQHVCLLTNHHKDMYLCYEPSLVTAHHSLKTHQICTID